MFRTEITPAKSPFNIRLQNPVLCIGSCFAQNMGTKLISYKFDTLVNPFGVLFNPVSIFKLINLASNNQGIDPSRLLFHEGRYHHPDLHSDFSHWEQREVVNRANQALQTLANTLDKQKIIIYTFGTAIVYEWKENGAIVANCHKIPASKFRRRFLRVDEIVSSFMENYAFLRHTNDDVKFILTVSPVRHLKESHEQNNVSKSILRLAIEKIINQCDGVYYFPAFEIMMDDLRDYRFYQEDMLHPSPVATNYIWQKFQDTFFDDWHKEFIIKWNKILRALQHKPFNPTGEQHQNFIKKTIDQLREFSPYTDITQELTILESQLL